MAIFLAGKAVCYRILAFSVMESCTSNANPPSSENFQTTFCYELDNMGGLFLADGVKARAVFIIFGIACPEYAVAVEVNGAGLGGLVFVCGFGFEDVS